MTKKILSAASLVGLPFLSFAQTSSTTGFYVGVGANLLTDVPFNSAGIPNLVGPSLTAGLPFSPRLALQLSAAYHWNENTYTNPAYYYGSGGSASSGGTSTYRYKYLTVPVLLRYTLTEPASRFHIDGLAGITVLYGHFKFSSTYPSGASYAYYYYPNDYTSSSTKASLSLGPAVRYSLAPHVELTANGLVSAILGDTYYKFSNRLFLNVLVGAQYSFGR